MRGIIDAIKDLYIKFLVWLGADPPEGFDQIEPGPARSQRYVVKEGDTIFSIARKFGVHYERIAQANNIDQLDALKPGQILTIPAPGRESEKKPAPTQPEKPKSDTKPSQPIPKEPVEEAPVEEPPKEQPLEEEPLEEEPLEEEPLEELPEWLEDVEPEEVVVPEEEAPLPEPTQEPLPEVVAEGPEQAEEEMVFRYEVQRGDTLNAIARKYGTTVKDLIESNELGDSNIYPGQKLVIPGYRLPKIEPAPEPPHRPLPDVGEQFVYTVAGGDTLGAIAKRYGITIRELIEANNLDDPNRIHIGQKLIIPGILAAPVRPTPQPKPTPIAGIDPDFPPLGPAGAVRALYASYFAIGHTEFRQRIFDLLDTTELNAVVIDAKSDYGWLSYPTQVARAREIGANRPTAQDFPDLMARLKERGIYTIARIVAFKDNLLAKNYPELAVKTQSGAVWQDADTMSWSDPFLSDVWNYNIEIATEAVRLGFDEIQFDFLRFPTVSPAGTPYFSQEISKETRVAAITSFLSAARGQLKPLGVKIAGSTFGYTCWRSDDSLIGQDIDRMGHYLDVLCPMLYPSTFGSGIPGYKMAVAHPYEVIYESAQRAIDRVKMSGCTVRPWLQDFQDYRFDRRTYGRTEIQAQIKGAFDSGCEGFQVWDPQVNYSDNAYAPIATPILSS
ncbi:MAG: LysM peptidoglycan-binding domain-containing protein [Anaerolineae bacterium]|nr:LysM peptidoglycan-binding domain-containing protein [Anaerolineae bacterium]